MKTFTVRDLDRQPGEVLGACDRDGLVRVQRRDGRAYLIQPEGRVAGKPDWTAFADERRAELAKLFPKPLTRKQTRQVDRIIAGE